MNISKGGIDAMESGRLRMKNKRVCLKQNHRSYLDLLIK